MDKRQEIFKNLSIIAVVMFSLMPLLIITACQPLRSTPPAQSVSPTHTRPTQTPQPTSTPGVETPTLQQPSATQTEQPSLTLPTDDPTPTPGCQDLTGEVLSDRIYSQHLADELSFLIYLPPCYQINSTHTYPSVYLLHGLYFNEDQWLRLGIADQMDRLIAEETIAPFIIVLPGESRFEPLQTSPYAVALIEELIPYIDEHYRTIPKQPFRAIGGLSRGAAWSVRIGLLHHPLFKSIGAHSLPGEPFTTGELVARLSQIPNTELPGFFIDTGQRDPDRSAAQNFADLLDENNVPHTWYLFNGGHTEDYWSTHLATYLQWYSRNW